MGYEEITHLGYVLSLSSELQSDQSSSRVCSETTPLPERPGFSVASGGWSGVVLNFACTGFSEVRYPLASELLPWSIILSSS